MQVLLELLGVTEQELLEVRDCMNKIVCLKTPANLILIFSSILLSIS